MAKGRFRLQFKFWLDVNKPDEYELAEIIANLKENKTFSKAIRDGIHLIWSLGQGNLDVLITLFPWVEDALYERFMEQQPVSDSTLQHQLARLENLIIEHGGSPVAAQDTGLKKLIIPQAVDNADNDLLVIKKSRSERESAQNFLSSAFNLVQ